MRRILHGQPTIGEDWQTEFEAAIEFRFGAADDEGSSPRVYKSLKCHRHVTPIPLSPRLSSGATCRRIRYRMFSQPGGLWANVITAKHTCPARHIALAYPGFPSICYSNPHHGKREHDDIVITRLQLASHRAHWIEVARDTKTDKPDFHKYLSDSMTFSTCCRRDLD
jgi:hypothetical protein